MITRFNQTSTFELGSRRRASTPDGIQGRGVPGAAYRLRVDLPLAGSEHDSA